MKSENYKKNKIVLVSPTVNSGEKERAHLQNFILTGRPTELDRVHFLDLGIPSFVKLMVLICCI